MMALGLPTGMHLMLKAKVAGKPVMRAYTPVTDDSTVGHVDLLVKVYFKGVSTDQPGTPEETLLRPRYWFTLGMNPIKPTRLRTLQPSETSHFAKVCLLFRKVARCRSI